MDQNNDLEEGISPYSEFNGKNVEFSNDLGLPN